MNNKNKIITTISLISTTVLGVITIFTATRLYQLRQETVAPTTPTQSFAWDCANYNFSVNSAGLVTVSNSSSSSEDTQNAEVYINDQLVNSFSVPALSPSESANLGIVNVPTSAFEWRVQGTKDCSNSGTESPPINSCGLLAFDLAVSSPTPTPTSFVVSSPTPTEILTSSPTPTQSQVVSSTPTPTNTPAPSNTPTPTDRPLGGNEPSNTPTSTSKPSSTPTDIIARSTSTPSEIADAGTTQPTSDQLPEAGTTLPTYIFSTFAILIIIAALGLAL